MTVDIYQFIEMINGTVREVKEFLDGEIKKYDSFEQCPDENIKALFAGKKGDFHHVKKNGSGRTTIDKFLKGAIPEWRIASIQKGTFNFHSHA